MPDPPRYAQVIVDVASANTDRVFTYRMPPGMALPPGTRVTVPFGRQTLEGVVLHLTDEPGIEESRIRDIIGALGCSAGELQNLSVAALLSKVTREGSAEQQDALRTLLAGLAKR